METTAHAQLKRLALAWLLREGFHAVAAEVRAPIMRYRADAAGYIDTAPVAPDHNHIAPDPASPQRALPFNGVAPRKPCEPRTVIIECKQSRADFLKDTADSDQLIGQRDRLLERKSSMERNVLPNSEPTLRVKGDSLFPDLDPLDLTDARNHEYRRLLKRLERVNTQLHGQTKFFWMSTYRMADRLYLLAPRGVVRPREIPPGWGLIETTPRLSGLRRAPIERLAEITLSLKRAAPDNSTRPRHRTRLLRNIAVAATRAHLLCADTNNQSIPPTKTSPEAHGSGSVGLPSGVSR